MHLDQKLGSCFKNCLIETVQGGVLDNGKEHFTVPMILIFEGFPATCAMDHVEENKLND